MRRKEKNDQTTFSKAAASSFDAAYQSASGKIPYNMTNDYMFRAVLQSDNKVLRGLICSLLHLAAEEVKAVEIANPIILGDAFKEKEFRLDINVVMNNSVLINMEMQITNKLNWENRSVMYLCRSYDQLNRGQDYSEARPAIHIGFLDYTLFDECPEFYASYKLVNVKTYRKYSDSLTLYVVDLSRTDLATDEDRMYHIHEWATLFKAATWEELKMIASKDEYLEEAAQTLFRMSADEEIRKRCRDREEYYQDLRSYERKIEQDRKEHEADKRSYERKIEQDRKKYEADKLNYEKKIEEERKEYEADKRNYERVIAEKERAMQDFEKMAAEYERCRKEQADELERLRTEIERLKGNGERGEQEIGRAGEERFS